MADPTWLLKLRNIDGLDTTFNKNNNNNNTHPYTSL